MDGVFHGYDELNLERIDLDFCWIPLEELRKGAMVYPLELIPHIMNRKKKRYILSQNIFKKNDTDIPEPSGLPVSFL